jgi:G:T/U-mismatch repair DNA glycosylase
MFIGSFPIGKFTDPRRRGEIGPRDIDFFFGGERNLLWRLLGECFNCRLDSPTAIMEFLELKGIAVGDVIRSCRRKEGRASDVDLYDIQWNTELLQIIEAHHISQVYFTSRRVELWFNRLFPQHKFNSVCLISPSAQSVRGLTRQSDYQEWKRQHPEGRGYDYILQRYKTQLMQLKFA